MPHKDPEARRAYKAAQYLRNKEEWNAKSRENYQKNREIRLAQAKAYYVANREKRIAYAIQYQKNNRETVRLKQRLWTEKNRAKVNLYHRELSCRLRRENPAKAREKDRRQYGQRRAWAMANKSRVREYCRRDYEKNGGRLNRWRANNPDKIRKYATVANLRRRERQAGAGKCSDPEGFRKFVAWVKTAERIPCRYCGETTRKGRTRHIDHFVPLCKGGTNELDNLVVACNRCNNRKHMKMPDEFIREITAPGTPARRHRRR